jgi:hypothetical protein
MNPDDFEKRLQRQPLRQVPSEWRAEILQHAASSRPSFVTTHSQRLSAILWPHPKAWAGLCAAWVLIFTVHFATSDHSQVVAKKAEPPSPQVLAALQQQKRLLAELVGQSSPQDADRPKPSGVQPRSERRSELLSA